MSFSSHTMVKIFIPGGVHIDPSHSHIEVKGGFLDFFMPSHFKVVNSKSEIPLTRQIFPIKGSPSHESLRRNTA